MALAVVLAARTVARSLSEAGRNLTEAVGGMWSGLNAPDPTFVPMDEFLAKKFLEDFERDGADSTELVLEQTDFSVDA